MAFPLAVLAVSRYFHSRGTPPPPGGTPFLAIAPLAQAQDVLSPNTASTRGTRFCGYVLSRGYPPLTIPTSCNTPLLSRLRHWLLYARYVLSYSTASTRHSRSCTWRSLSCYFHSRGTSTLTAPLPTSRHPLSCDSTTGLGSGCRLTHYCLYTRYPLLRGTSSLVVSTSLAMHPSFAAPPLALLCPVCPLIQHRLYTSFALLHVAFPLTVFPLSRYFKSRGTSTLTVPLRHLEAPRFLQ